MLKTLESWLYSTRMVSQLVTYIKNIYKRTRKGTGTYDVPCLAQFRVRRTVTQLVARWGTEFEVFKTCIGNKFEVIRWFVVSAAGEMSQKKSPSEKARLHHLSVSSLTARSVGEEMCLLDPHYKPRPRYVRVMLLRPNNKAKPEKSIKIVSWKWSANVLVQRRKVRLIESSAKCRYLENLPVNGLRGRFFSVWGPLPS